MTRVCAQVQQLLLLPAPPSAMSWGGEGRGLRWELVVAAGGGGLQRLRGVKSDEEWRHGGGGGGMRVRVE
jgi:hypothetical protein